MFVNNRQYHGKNYCKYKVMSKHKKSDFAKAKSRAKM